MLIREPKPGLNSVFVPIPANATDNAQSNPDNLQCRMATIESEFVNNHNKHSVEHIFSV